MAESLKYGCKLVCAAAVCCFAGCGHVAESPTATAIEARPEAVAKYLLSAEPAGAVGVMKARAVAKDDQPVVVVGCVGSGAGAWIEGRSAFVLVDSAAASACIDDGCEDGCTCHAEEMADASTLVKFLDEQGKVLAVDSRELLGLHGQQTVVVQGKAKRDSDGNLTVMADAIFVRR